MATCSPEWTSTAAKDVAGSTGGGVCSEAAAGRAMPMIRGSRRAESLIVRDCIIVRLDSGTAVSVTHGSFFLQSGSSGGACGHGALVAVEDGRRAEVPSGAVGAAGQDAGSAARWGPAGDLAACGFSGRGAGRKPACRRAGAGLSRAQIADFDHHAHRPGSGPPAVRRGTSLLLSSGSAVGGAGVPRGHS